MGARSPRYQRVLAATIVLAAALAGCASPRGPGGADSGDATNETPGSGTDGDGPPVRREGIAWERLPGDSAVPQANASRLMDLVDRQVYWNASDDQRRYRTPGTRGHEATIPELEGMLEEAGASVTSESFQVELPDLGTVNATNVYGERPGSGDREIWLAAHWDSRAWADQALNESRRDQPVLGANDGAGAVAVAVHALERLPSTNATIRVALFDVEDQGQGFEGWIQGSSHAAKRLSREQLSQIEALILVDMPGHEQLSIQREGRSHRQSAPLTNVAFGVAERLESPSFHNVTGPPILDDHVPFLERNVSAVDLIHLDDNGTTSFPWTWHTPHDTPEHLSGDSMAEVTRVVVGTAMAVDRGALPPDR